MKTNVLSRALVFPFLIAFSGIVSASSGIMLYGVSVSNTFFVSLYCFFAAFYYATRAHRYHKSMLLWWFFGLFLSLSLLIVAVILVKTFLPYVSMFAENIIALFVAVVLTGVTARLLVSRFDTSILTSVCLMASIPVVLAAYVSAFDIHTRSAVEITQRTENKTEHKTADKSKTEVVTESVDGKAAVPVTASVPARQKPEKAVQQRVQHTERPQRRERLAVRTKLPTATEKRPRAAARKRARTAARRVLRSAQARRRSKRGTVRRSRALAVRPARRNWVIQVASFSVRTNANRLKARLGRQGYKVFIAEENRVDRSMYRVRVGPVFDRTEADSLIRKLGSEQNLSGIVLQHR